MRTAMQRLAWRFSPIPLLLFANGGHVTPSPCDSSSSITTKSTHVSSASSSSNASSFSSPKEVEAEWSSKYPTIVTAGEPILHQPAREVDLHEVKSDEVQKVIDDLISAMRSEDIVSLSAPQIGVPLKIIVLEDKKDLCSELNLEGSYKVLIEAMLKVVDRKPFDLLVILNPKLEKKSNKTAVLPESCVSVPGYCAMVERCCEVEVTGFDRYGEPIKIKASGWQARILQHECDHLDGTLYAENMVPKTFTTKTNQAKMFRDTFTTKMRVKMLFDGVYLYLKDLIF